MKYSAISKIEQLTRQYKAKLEIDESKDGSYIDCIINTESLDIYVLAKKFGDDYFAYGLESTLLPRELYPDNIETEGFSEKDRNGEILKNVELLLSKEIKFYPSPSFINKRRGYILLNIDGTNTKLFQKDDKITR